MNAVNKKLNKKPLLIILILSLVLVGVYSQEIASRNVEAQNSTASSSPNKSTENTGFFSKIDNYFGKAKDNPSLDRYADFKNQIKAVLGSDSSNYAVYISVLSSGESIGINEDKIMLPASISKLPVAVLILKDVEAGKLKLTNSYPLLEKNKAYESDQLYSYKTGSSLSLQTYLKYMISESDNTAMTTLENILGGSDKINERTKSELGVANLFRDPHETTAKNVGQLLEGIYAKKYLNQTNNDILIDMMTDSSSWFQDRIVAGVPADIKVAHKIGQIDTDDGESYEDAAIVYGPKNAYVIVILNQDIQRKDAIYKIQVISRQVYNYFNS